VAEEQTPETPRPAFSAPLWAAARQGAKELAQVLPAFPDSVRPVEEPGTLGNPTQAMVTQEIGTFQGYQQDAGYQQMLDGYADPKSVHGKEPEKGIGTEM
jgi:hypothetical protein